jgi:heavy metal sensor kinase
VGRDIGPEVSALHRYAWLLFGAGSVVFVLGLAGGSWISTRALRPIQDISATAGNIAAGDLSQRIPEQDSGTELGDLAAVLNDTFARLQASFARQAQFTADASHELRTPVSVVLTQTQTALARERPAAEYRESLEACQRAALRMRRLTESLLTLARLDAGRSGETPRTACDLARIAAESVDLLRPLATERGVELKIEAAPISCLGDPEQLGQIVTNLVSNAIQYNQPSGSVVVSVSVVSGEAVLSVRDTGQGMSAEEIPHVFERFYRADKSRTGSSGHTGLGLSITEAIVKAHAGTIHVESEKGKGSTFTVYLPLLQG